MFRALPFSYQAGAGLRNILNRFLASIASAVINRTLSRHRPRRRTIQ
jgi:hypothetical protein